MDQVIESALETGYLMQDVTSIGGKLRWGLHPSDSVVYLTYRPYYQYFGQFPAALHSSDQETFCLSQMQNVLHPCTPYCQSCIWDVAGKSYLQIASAHPVTKLISPAGKSLFLLVKQQFYQLWAIWLIVLFLFCTSLEAQYQCMSSLQL